MSGKPPDYTGDALYYRDREQAAQALDACHSGHEPAGWFRHPQSGRRRENGDPARDGVSGDMLITHEHSEAFGRLPKIANFLVSGASDESPLPSLHDFEVSWMGSNGFVLTGIEFIRQTAYAQSSWCRVPDRQTRTAPQ